MRQMLMVLVLLGLAVPASAQVSIDDVPRIAQAIHDAEGINIGAGSTRDYRNAFWARVVGAIVWGLPPYNTKPDASWCLKDGGSGRPQSDDVIVKCASREFWDCIPGSGANGYRFSCSKDAHPLPMEQNVYAPPKPAGGGTTGDGGGTPLPAPPSLAPVLDLLKSLHAKVDALSARVAAVEAKGTAIDAAAFEALNAASRASDIKTLIQNLPASQPVPCLKGACRKRSAGRPMSCSARRCLDDPTPLCPDCRLSRVHRRDDRRVP